MGKRKKIKVNVGKLPDAVYREALMQGMKVLLNRQYNKRDLINEIYDMAVRYVKLSLDLPNSPNTDWVTEWYIHRAAHKFIKGRIREMEDA